MAARFYSPRTAQRLQSEQEVREATHCMLNYHIPQIAQKLVEVACSLAEQERYTFLFRMKLVYSSCLTGGSDWLSFFMHFHGVNMRHIGRLRIKVLDGASNSCNCGVREEVATFLLIELISRCLKNLMHAQLREQMRLQKYPGTGALTSFVEQLMFFFQATSLTFELSFRF